MTHLSHEEDGMVWACPECDIAAVYRRDPTNPQTQGDSQFRCRNCHHEFHTPIERKKNDTTGRGSRSNLEMLLDQNPQLRDEHGIGFQPASELRTDGAGHVCECGESFRTLTRLRLHEKDDCSERAVYDELDPDANDVGRQGAEGLLTCRNCGQENPNADYDQTTSLSGDDYHLIVEFPCRHCGFSNENRVVLEGIDQSSIDQLPPHLQPTDGGDV